MSELLKIPDVHSIVEFHDFLKKEGLYRAYEEGEELKVRISAHSMDIDHTEEEDEFYISSYTNKSILVLFGDKESTRKEALVWDDKDGGIGFSVEVEGQRGRLEFGFIRMLHYLWEEYSGSRTKLPSGTYWVQIILSE